MFTEWGTWHSALHGPGAVPWRACHVSGRRVRSRGLHVAAAQRPATVRRPPAGNGHLHGGGAAAAARTAASRRGRQMAVCCEALLGPGDVGPPRSEAAGKMDASAGRKWKLDPGSVLNWAGPAGSGHGRQIFGLLG